MCGLHFVGQGRGEGKREDTRDGTTRNMGARFYWIISRVPFQDEDFLSIYCWSLNSH